MSEVQRALAGFHGDASPALLERGKASRLLELTTVVISEKLGGRSIQKRQIFRPSFQNSNRFLVTPSPSSSDPLEQLLNDALSDIKKDVLSSSDSLSDVTPPAVGSLRVSANLYSVIKTLSQVKGEECVDEESSNACDPSEPYRSFSGRCNNLRDTKSASNVIYERLLPPRYGDGVQAPRTKSVLGTPLPTPRQVSSILHAVKSGEEELDQRFVTPIYLQRANH